MEQRKMKSFAVPALTEESGFLSYLRQIRSIPSLEVEEEYMLAKRYQEHSDLRAAHKLVTSHLKLVAKIAIGYKNYGMPIVEMVSEGNLGLMQAVKKFDPERGFRLSTYAVWWIKSAIQEYILRSWSLVKIGTKASQKKLFFNLNKIKRKIYNLESRDLNASDYKKVAEDLNVLESDVAEMDIRMHKDTSLNAPATEDYESSTLMDVLPATLETHETTILENQDADKKMTLLKSAISKLSEREQHIIEERHFKENPSTLSYLSALYSVSPERIRQIEERALEKIQQFCRDNYNAH
jgi:RNA polymerase sigma-32 factor